MLYPWRLSTSSLIRVQDTRLQRLYFVDIDACKVYTYEPSSGIVGYEVFEKKITAIALTEEGDGVGVTYSK